MRAIFILVLGIIMFSCGSDDPEMSYVYDAGEYNAHVQKFSSLYTAEVENLIIKRVDGNIPINLGDSIRTARPHDSYSISGQNYIEIDTAFFNKQPEMVEKAIFHELGRIYLKRDFEFNFISLMYFQPIAVRGYANEGEKYFQYELWKNSPVKDQFEYTGKVFDCLVLRRPGLPCGGGNPHSCQEESLLVCDFD